MNKNRNPKLEITDELLDDSIKLLKKILELQVRYANLLESALGISGYKYIYDYEYLDNNKITLFPGHKTPKENESIKWFFHGQEVDVTDKSSGMSVRIEYGPNGRLDCFTEDSMSHILINKGVAKEFTNIHSFIENAYDYGHWGTDLIFDALRDRRVIDYLEPTFMRLTEKYSEMDEDGVITTSIPEHLIPKKPLIREFYWKHIMIDQS